MTREEGTTRSGLYFCGLGQGPTVVVLHGGPGADHGYLLPQFAALSDELRLLFYDQRGGGRSRTGNPAPSWQDHVSDLESLRLEMGLDRMLLIGYSFGGLLALLYTLEHPGGADRLALVSPAPPVHTYREPMARTLRERTARAESLGLTGFARAVAGYFADPLRARELTPFRVQTRAERSVQASLGDYDLRPRLAEITQPVLVVHGTEDPIPIRYSEELAERLPHGRLVELAHCGHVPYVEAAKALFDSLVSFLK